MKIMNTLEFAAYELNRYSAAMGIAPDITLAVDEAQFDAGRFFRFDARYDDAFIIKVADGKGNIIATNERAVLLGVYHFLKRQGCRFIHPEAGGEYIPLADAVVDVDETWYAKLRHRGTTDGAAYFSGDGRNIDLILKYIDFLPKIMANSLMLESTDTFHRMYGRYQYPDNPYKTPDELSRAQFEKYDKMIVEAMKKRGLLRHGAGHGWTVEVMGKKIHSPEDDPAQFKPERIALIDGKRQVHRNGVLHTNLCYSNPVIRKEIAEAVGRYAVEHPEVDFIHVWLADYFSNFCECDACRKKTPTDWYIKILNEVDEVLTKQGSDKKVVFILYFELGFPPITEKIQNEDRFVMMFAPYGRDFHTRYSDSPKKPYDKHLPLNTYSKALWDTGIYRSQLSDWKEIFKGDSILFDYMLYEHAFHTEITHVGYAKHVYDEILFHKNLQVNGHIECGDYKGMFPTSLAYHGMFTAMFYGEIPYEEMEADVLDAAFGEGNPMKAFLHRMYELMPRRYIKERATTKGIKFIPRPMGEDERQQLLRARELTRDFKKTVFAYVPDEMSQRLNCFYFREYLDILEYVQTVMLERDLEYSPEWVAKKEAEYKRLVFYKEMAMPGIMDGRNWFRHILEVFIQ